MSAGHEAYDAELTAITYGLLLLAQGGEGGRAFTMLTDSRAGMERVSSDAPEPGEEIATDHRPRPEIGRSGQQRHRPVDPGPPRGGGKRRPIRGRGRQRPSLS